MSRSDELIAEANDLMGQADGLEARASALYREADAVKKQENIAKCKIKVGDKINADEDHGGGLMTVTKVFEKQDGAARLVKGYLSDGKIAYAYVNDEDEV
jgi:hypothetical protein